jgi:hypothetical protein
MRTHYALEWGGRRFCVGFGGARWGESVLLVFLYPTPIQEAVEVEVAIIEYFCKCVYTEK